MNRILRATTIGMLACVLIAGCGTTDSVFVQPSQPHGIIEFKIPNPSHNPVRLVQIDDQNITGSDVRRSSFWLRPGTYTLKLAMMRGPAQTVGRGSSGRRDPGPNTVQIKIEQGKRYRIAARVTGAQTDQWEPVIWEVRDIGG